MVHLLRVVFELLPHLGHFRGEERHFAHLVRRFVLDRPERGFDQDRENDDRPRVVADEGVEAVHRPEKEFADKSENPETHDLLLRGAELAEALEFFGPGVNLE